MPPGKRAAVLDLPCPVPGCGLRVTRPGQAARLECRTIPVTALDGGTTLTCPCQRHAPLRVVRRRTGLALSVLEFGRDARAEHNLIAHALVSGQGHAERGRRHRLDRAADPDSGDFDLAWRETDRLQAQVVEHLLAGRLQAAVEVAEQAAAARDRRDALGRRLTRRHRRVEREQAWHDMTRFWIRIPVPVTTPPGERDEPPLTPQFTFTFVALWDQDNRELEVANGEEIEAAAGLTVGADGWRALIRLLTRWESAPGRDPDPHALIWRDDRGTLTLREHVRRHYPRAVVALEALRLTLTPDQRRPRGAAPEPHPDWAGDAPPWVLDAAPADPVLRAIDAQIEAIDERDQAEWGGAAAPQRTSAAPRPAVSGVVRADQDGGSSPSD
ncbi:hypothetical protein [Deinococcus rufus]|uniref:Uncharacterized protein n=1 Tax=Deinococcus rufus TaxID=2136097 RepID=A0ABV7ZB84_9DEIO